MVLEQLQTHLDTNNLEAKFQSAYICDHSTKRWPFFMLWTIFFQWLMLERSLPHFAGLKCHLWHNYLSLLLERLHDEIFVQGTVLEWFKSCLLCRFLQVLVGQSYSAGMPLLCGVPQGSVLSPLYFSLYAKQFAKLIQKHSIDYHLFADDSELYSCLLIERKSALRQSTRWSRAAMR